MGRLNRIVVATSLVGVAVCLYAMHVEKKAEAHPFTYQAYCDLSPHVQCSKVLTSPQSHLLRHLGLVPRGSSLDVPNTYLGLAYYLFMLSFPVGRFFFHSAYSLASFFSTALSVYLGYLLYAVLNDFCLVCVTTYVLNFILFVSVLSARRLVYVAREKRERGGGGGAGRRSVESKPKQT